MSLFLRIDINIVAIALLLATFFIAKKNLDKQDKLNKIYLVTSIMLILEIAIETATCMLNGQPVQWMIPLTTVLHSCLFIIAPILTYCWYVFIVNWIDFGNYSLLKRIALFIPVAANTILVVLSPIYGYAFSIRPENIYQRGPLFFVLTLITFFYMGLCIVMLLAKKKNLMQEEFFPLITISSVPIIGGVLQTMFYGTLLVWSSAAFSFVIVYIYLQQRMIHLDKLTGAWTRESLNYHILRRKKYYCNEKLGIIFLDLDGLKRINDMFGHMEGDCALHTSVELIKSVIRKTDIVARFGGDEFVIVLECENKLTLEKTMERMKICFTKYNETSEKNYLLEYSFGADMLNADFEDIDQFLYHVDHLMYSNKRLKKETGILS